MYLYPEPRYDIEYDHNKRPSGLIYKKYGMLKISITGHLRLL